MKKKSMFYVMIVIALLTAFFVQAQETCEKYGIVEVSGGQYKLANNVWGADTRQCIRSTGSTGFTVAVSEHNQGSVAAYPSIWKGCHWGDCTTNSGMPVRVSSAGSASFSYSVSSTRPSGDYNVAAECWLSADSDSTDGYNGGAEIMIVLDYHGMNPAGSQIGTFNGHNVYYASVGWNFVTYVKTGRSSASGNMMDFINDAASRGYVDRSWYLHDMEAGFEIMKGGQGLTCNSFSFSVGGGGSTTTTTSSGGSTTTTSSGGSTTSSGGGDLGCGICNWYGTNYPMCCTTQSGWGFEQGKSCISQSTCDSQNGGTPVPTQGGTTPVPTATPAGATPAPTATPGGGGSSCSPSTSITVPFTKDGSGDFCWETSTLGSYINSWNVTTLTLNGVDCTNKFVSSANYPAQVNGKYYIRYVASYGWSHFEAKN